MPALMLATALLAPIVAPAGPAEASARAFIQSIYGFYRKGGTGAPLKRPERWFEPRLAAAIRADIAETDRTGDMGKLDADLFCDCQDFDDIRATIGPVSIAAGKATTAVVVDNGGPVTLTYTLAWTRAGWRVFDIAYQEGTLREVFLPQGTSTVSTATGSVSG